MASHLVCEDTVHVERSASYFFNQITADDIVSNNCYNFILNTRRGVFGIPITETCVGKMLMRDMIVF